MGAPPVAMDPRELWHTGRPAGGAGQSTNRTVRNGRTSSIWAGQFVDRWCGCQRRWCSPHGASWRDRCQDRSRSGHGRRSLTAAIQPERHSDDVAQQVAWVCALQARRTVSDQLGGGLCRGPDLVGRLGRTRGDDPWRGVDGHPYQEGPVRIGLNTRLLEGQRSVLKHPSVIGADVGAVLHRVDGTESGELLGEVVSQRAGGGQGSGIGGGLGLAALVGTAGELGECEGDGDAEHPREQEGREDLAILLAGVDALPHDLCAFFPAGLGVTYHP